MKLEFILTILLSFITLISFAQYPKVKIESARSSKDSVVYPKKITSQSFLPSNQSKTSNKIYFNQIDSEKFKSNLPHKHNWEISKDDSIKLVKQNGKDILEDYLLLKYKAEFARFFIDSLYDSGLKIDSIEYNRLYMERSKEILKNRKNVQNKANSY